MEPEDRGVAEGWKEGCWDTLALAEQELEAEKGTDEGDLDLDPGGSKGSVEKRRTAAFCYIPTNPVKIMCKNIYNI